MQSMQLSISGTDPQLIPLLENEENSITNRRLMQTRQLLSVICKYWLPRNKWKISKPKNFSVIYFCLKFVVQSQRNDLSLNLGKIFSKLIKFVISFRDPHKLLTSHERHGVSQKTLKSLHSCPLCLALTSKKGPAMWEAFPCHNFII